MKPDGPVSSTRKARLCSVAERSCAPKWRMHVAPQSSVRAILLSLQFASGRIEAIHSIGICPLQLRLRLPWTAAVLRGHFVCRERSQRPTTRQQQQDTARKQKPEMTMTGIEHDKSFRRCGPLRAAVSNRCLAVRCVDSTSIAPAKVSKTCRREQGTPFRGLEFPEHDSKPGAAGSRD